MTCKTTDLLTKQVSAEFAKWRHGPALPTPQLPTIRKTITTERLPKLESGSRSPSPTSTAKTPSRAAHPAVERPANIPIPTEAEPEKLKAYLFALRYRDEFDVMFGLPRLVGPVPPDDEPEKLRAFLAELCEREEAKQLHQPERRTIAPPVMVPRGRR